MNRMNRTGGSAGRTMRIHNQGKSAHGRSAGPGGGQQKQKMKNDFHKKLTHICHDHFENALA